MVLVVWGVWIEIYLGSPGREGTLSMGSASILATNIRYGAGGGGKHRGEKNLADFFLFFLVWRDLGFGE